VRVVLRPPEPVTAFFVSSDRDGKLDT